MTGRLLFEASLPDIGLQALGTLFQVQVPEGKQLNRNGLICRGAEETFLQKPVGIAGVQYC